MYFYKDIITPFLTVTLCLLLIVVFSRNKYVFVYLSKPNTNRIWLRFAVYTNSVNGLIEENENTKSCTVVFLKYSSVCYLFSSTEKLKKSGSYV